MIYHCMPNAVLPVQLEIGGDPVQVNVLVFQGPGGHDSDPDAELLVFSPDPSTASISLHPDPEKNRSVILTPGFLEGTVTCMITSTPEADENLVLEVTNVTPPSLRRIVPDPVRPITPVED